MKKEYRKIIFEKLNANMQPSGESEEQLLISLIADEGKLIRHKIAGITGTRVDIGTGDSEDNYEEIDV